MPDARKMNTWKLNIIHHTPSRALIDEEESGRCILLYAQYFVCKLLNEYRLTVIHLSHFSYVLYVLQAFTSGPAFVSTASARSTSLSITIADGVEFDKIAREWRCKWSGDNDKASLVEAQKALESVLPTIKKVDGVLSVERIVCGGCLDLKVVTTLPADKFGGWEEKGFAPEADFLKKLEGISGISVIETQTYTKMPM